MDPKSWMKIGSVTAEILLIWTTYVAWTNVTITIGICERLSQEPIFKVWNKCCQNIYVAWIMKFGQNKPDKG